MEREIILHPTMPSRPSRGLMVHQGCPIVTLDSCERLSCRKRSDDKLLAHSINQSFAIYWAVVGLARTNAR